MLNVFEAIHRNACILKRKCTNCHLYAMERSECRALLKTVLA